MQKLANHPAFSGSGSSTKSHETDGFVPVNFISDEAYVILPAFEASSPPGYPDSGVVKMRVGLDRVACVAVRGVCCHWLSQASILLHAEDRTKYPGRSQSEFVWLSNTMLRAIGHNWPGKHMGQFADAQTQQ